MTSVHFLCCDFIISFSNSNFNNILSSFSAIRNDNHMVMTIQAIFFYITAVQSESNSMSIFFVFTFPIELFTTKNKENKWFNTFAG